MALVWIASTDFYHPFRQFHLRLWCIPCLFRSSSLSIKFRRISIFSDWQPFLLMFLIPLLNYHSKKRETQYREDVEKRPSYSQLDRRPPEQNSSVGLIHSRLHSRLSHEKLPKVDVIMLHKVQNPTSLASIYNVYDLIYFSPRSKDTQQELQRFTATNVSTEIAFSTRPQPIASDTISKPAAFCLKPPLFYTMLNWTEVSHVDYI